MTRPPFDRSTIGIVLSESEGSSAAVAAIVESFGSHVKWEGAHLGMMTVHVEEEYAEALMDALDDSPHVSFCQFVEIPRPCYELDRFEGPTYTGWLVSNSGPAQAIPAALSTIAAAGGGNAMRITGSVTNDGSGNVISGSGFHANGAYDKPAVFPKDAEPAADAKVVFAYRSNAPGTILTVAGVQLPLIEDGGWHTMDTVVPVTHAIQIDILNSPQSASASALTFDIDNLNVTLIQPLRPILRAVADDGKIDVEWKAQTDVTSYRVYWTADGTIPTTASSYVITGTTSYTFDNLTNGTTYKFCVVAVGNYGTSELSAVATSVPQKHVTGYVPKSPLYPLQKNGMEAINAHRAWTITKGSVSFAAVITDTGQDVGHPDYGNKAGWSKDLYTGGLVTRDSGFHGDMTAGVFAIESEEGIIGVCPKALIYPVTLSQSGGTHYPAWDFAIENKDKVRAFNYSWGAQALPNIAATRVSDIVFTVSSSWASSFPDNQRVAADIGTKVVFGTVTSTSTADGVTTCQVAWDGTPPTSYTTVCALNMLMESAVQRAWDNGIVTCISMGNDGFYEMPGFLASKAVMVASSTKGWLENYSNYGPCVTIAAPGNGSISTAPRYGHGVSSLSSSKTFTATFVTGQKTATLTSGTIAGYTMGEVSGAGVFTASDGDRAVIMPESSGATVVFNKPSAVSGTRQFTVNMGYSYMAASGTSFSAPLVVAAILQLVSVKPTITPAEIVENITATAQPFPSLTGLAGAGGLDIYRSLLRVVKVHAGCDVTVDYDANVSATIIIDKDESAVDPVRAFYTTDGSVPTLSSTQYTGPFSAPLGSTITYMAADSAPTPSVGVVRTVAVPASAPVMPIPPEPQITQFTLTPSAGSLTVAVTLTATDDVAVTGYYVSESTATPDHGQLIGNDEETWDPIYAPNDFVASAPTTHTFTSAGDKTLYAWVLDADGHVTGPVSSTATVTAAMTGTFALPAVTLQPVVAAPTLTGRQRGTFAAPAVTLRPVVTAPTLTGVQRGSFTMPSVTLTPTVTAPTLNGVSVAVGAGAFTLPAVTLRPIVTAPRLYGMTGGASIRAPSGQILNLRRIDGTPFTILSI